MKSRRIIAALTAAAAALSMIAPSAASGAETAYFLKSDRVLTDTDYNVFANPENADSAEEAAAYLRNAMKQRKSSAAVTVPKNGYSNRDEASLDILARSVSETSAGDEGDYLRFALKSYNYGNEASQDGKIILYYTMTYYSSAEDEKAVSEALKGVEAELDCNGRSDYEKICRAYDFVTSYVSYAEEYEDERIFTAYGALVDRSCVCQGYTLLLYRILKDLGVDCRILSGTSGEERHTWNIVRIGDKYFFLDPTWDSSLGGTEGIFFLRGSNDFDALITEVAHIPVYEYEEIFPDYESAEFKAAYPQAEDRFILGDVDENGVIDGKDASYVLTCYAAMSVSGSNFSLPPVQSAAADITGDCIIDGNDASGLLSYYAAVSAGKKLSLNEYLRQNRKS